MARIRRRAKSNTLFRLVKSLSFGQYTKLKAFNDVYAKGSKQWRLIEYYYHQKEWSREKELSDWPEERFATLKYHTLQWLLRALSRTGEWPGNTLFHIYGDISIALKHQVFECADDFWEEVKPKAINEERFGLVLEYLALQRVLARSSTTLEDAQIQLLENLELCQKMISLHNEVLEVESLRIKYFDPIKYNHSQNGLVPIVEAEELRIQMAGLNYNNLHSIRAKYGFLRMQIFLDLLDGLPNASETIALLIEIQISNPWLREDDLGKFFMDIRSAIFVFAGKGDLEKAKDYIGLFDLYDFDDPWIFSVGVIPKIESLLWFGLFLNDANTTRIGLSLLVEKVDQFRQDCPKGTFIRIVQYAAIAEMLLGNPKSANRWLEELLNLKSSIKTDRISSARVMQLMCFLLLDEDPVFIEGKASTVLRNLRRNDYQYPNLNEIALSIGRIARCGDDPDCKIAEIKRLLEELKKTGNEAKTNIALEHFDYTKWFENLLIELTVHQ